ncbi:MAG: hypothetical protein LBD11_01220 [Candidatus Peribacteria bacterium]|jgi:hypothetical protein|nr:hypothetical protein [Candidatus Peribacteria bacterium]
MKQKQNVVVKRSMIALAGVFSLMGLLLFWGQDFIKAAGNEAPENGVFGIDNRVEYLHSLTFVMT